MLKAAAAKQKRERRELTQDEKREIIDLHKSKPEYKQVELIKIFSKKFDYIIPRQTMSDIINHEKLNNPNKSTGNTYRNTDARFPDLENALFLWFTDMRSRRIPISNDILIEKAKKFSDLLYTCLEVYDFKYSPGWLSNFKKRHGISCKSIHGESGGVDSNYIKIEREKLKLITASYSLEDIYNLDETALFFKLTPNKTLSNEAAAGEKINKERVTVALCCNATGSDKVKPIVIHRCKRPHCFSGSYDPNSFCYYFHNKKAWMTSLVFSEWLEKFNNLIKLRKATRKVLLLVDNASGHNLPICEISNVKVVYLTQNATSVLQPLDAGIIRTFKSYYRKSLVNFSRFN
jgi:hypothetical protein